MAVKSDSTASTGRLVLWSAPDHLDPESTCCRCETAVVRHHDELLLRAIAPDERSGEMKRVQRSKRSGKRFRRTREDSSLEQDEIHGFEPVLYGAGRDPRFDVGTKPVLYQRSSVDSDP